MKLFSTFQFVVLGLLLLWGLSFGDNMMPTVMKTGEALPVIDLMSLSNHTVSTSELKYPLLISVFTTWCTICRKELPLLNDISAEARSKHVALNIVGIDAGEGINKVASFQRKQKLGFDVMIDPDLKLIKKLQILGTPVVLIFNKKGQLTYQGNEIPAEWLKLIQ